MQCSAAYLAPSCCPYDNQNRTSAFPFRRTEWKLMASWCLLGLSPAAAWVRHAPSGPC